MLIMDTLFLLNFLVFNFLGPEMLIVLFAILLLFGGKKIPELMRGIGKGIREFNTARSTVEKELKDGMREAERKEKEKKAEEPS
jgi:sec-independent protein translocase protein TatA